MKMKQRTEKRKGCWEMQVELIRKAVIWRSGGQASATDKQNRRQQETDR